MKGTVYVIRDGKLVKKEPWYMNEVMSLPGSGYVGLDLAKELQDDIMMLMGVRQHKWITDNTTMPPIHRCEWCLVTKQLDERTGNVCYFDKYGTRCISEPRCG